MTTLMGPGASAGTGPGPDPAGGAGTVGLPGPGAASVTDGGPPPVRVTVVGPTRRADVALPATVSLVSLVPVLARRLVDRPDPADADPRPDTAWVLQRVGEAPFEEGVTAEDADLLDGEVLHLRPAEAPMAEFEVDDVAAGLGDAVSRRAGRWAPGATRVAFLAAAAAAQVVLAVLLLRGGAVAGSGLLLSVEAWLLALAATGGAAGVAWTTGDRAAVLVLGLGGTGFAALAGLVVGQGVLGAFAPDAPALVVAGISVVAQAGSLLLLTPGEGTTHVVWGSAVGVGASAFVGGLLVVTGLAGPVSAAAVVALLVYLVATLGPRAAVRLARLRVPVLPRTAEELQADVDPLPSDRLSDRAGRAERWLTMFTVAASVVSVPATVMLAGEGWTGPAAAAVLAAAMLLQARVYVSAVARTALLVAGATNLAVLALLGTVSPTAATQLLLVLGFALLVAAAVLASQRMPTARILPVWGHTGDILEMLLAVALVPLTLAVLGVFAFFRGLFG